MLNAQIHTDIEGLEKDLDEYISRTSKTPAEALAHQGDKLRYSLYRGFRAVATPQGRARSDVLGLFDNADSSGSGRRRRGRGIVRKSVRDQVRKTHGVLSTRARGSRTRKRRGKRLNLQALMVDREIALRERGRSYLGSTFLLPQWRSAGPQGRTEFVKRGGTVSHRNRQQSVVTRMIATGSGETDRSLRLLGEARGAGQVGERRGIVSRAINEVRADIQGYLLRKDSMAAKRSFRGGRMRKL